MLGKMCAIMWKVVLGAVDLIHANLHCHRKNVERLTDKRINAKTKVVSGGMVHRIVLPGGNRRRAALARK